MFLGIIDLAGIASANLRPTELNNFASIPEQRFHVSAASATRSPVQQSSQRVSLPSSRRTHPLHPSWIRLCGSKRGTTPSARDESSDRHLVGRVSRLSGDLVKHLEPPSLTHDNKADSTLSTADHSAGLTVPRRDRKRAQYRRLYGGAALVATNVDLDLVHGFQLIGTAHSCPYCMQTQRRGGPCHRLHASSQSSVSL